MRQATHSTDHSPAVPFQPAEEDVQKCAYFLWQEQGCPAGRDLELWLAAKELLRHRHGRGPAQGHGRSHLLSSRP